MTAAAPTTEARAGNKPRVLCVDDEPFVLDGLRDTLRRSFDVRVAGGAAEALEMLRTAPDDYAIVISDMRMPEKPGDVFLREARMIAPNAVRMLLTGQADVEAAIRAVNQAQLFRFLTKPCEHDELLRACAAALGHHRLMTAERVLLEQTLRGCVEALAEVLALASPAAFGRGARLKDLAGRLAAAAGLDNSWEIEVAATLVQLGAVTLPQATAEKLYSGEVLAAAEETMVQRIPAVTRRLLAKIPRLDGILAILDGCQVTPEPGDYGQINATAVGARVLRIAMDYDELESRGATEAVALGGLASRGIYDRQLLEAFAKVVGVGGRAPVVREISVAQLAEGMVIADDVRNLGGHLLVARGQTVTDQLIDRLTYMTGDAVRQPILIVEPEAEPLV